MALSLSASCGGDSLTGKTRIGPPAELEIVSGDEQSGTVGVELPEPVVVKVTDANGHGVVGQVINFRVTAGGGSVFAGASSTNADGIAQERWTLGTVAGTEQTLDARAVDNSTGQALVFGTFHATAVAGPATALAILTQPAAAARVGSPLSPQPSVRLLDKYGNAVLQQGVQVDASVIPAVGYQLSGTSSVATDQRGVATFTDLSVSGQPGSITLSFAGASLTSVASSAITLSAADAAAINAVTSTSLSDTVDNRLPDSFVKVTDGAGNPVSGVAVTFTGAPGSNWGTSTVSTNDQGLAGFSWVLPQTVGTYTVSAAASGLLGSPVVFTATTTPGAATHISIVSGGSFTDTVGKATPPLVVRVADDYGNLVPGATVGWRAVVLNGGGIPTLSASSSVTGPDGTTQISATLQTVTGSTSTGTANVIASLTNGASVSFALTALAGPPASITKQTGDGQSAQASATLPLPIVVRVIDRYGNPANAIVNFAVISGDGSVSPSSGESDAGGIVGAEWTLGPAAGTQHLTATTGSLSTTFSATALSLQLAIVQQPPTSAQATFAISPSPSVQLVDGSGAPVKRSGIVVTASVPAPYALSGLSTMATDGDGVATFKIALSGAAGSVSISFGGAGLTGVTTAPVALAAQQPMTLKWNYADGGSQPVGSYLIDPMTLRVTDSNGNPLSNVIVTFTVVAGGGTITTFDQYLVNPNQVTSAPQTADTNGQAMVRTWTLGPNPGPDTIRAKVGDLHLDFTINGIAR